MISIIVSISKNNCIGGNNTLLWKQSEDLKRFKDITTGHPVIMGQKTYESIGKLLPKRMNIILSDEPGFTVYGAYVVRTIDQAVSAYYNYSGILSGEKPEIFIIGGGSIYRQFLPLADKLYITRIDAVVEGDTYFPEIGEEWNLVFQEPHEKDDKNQYNYTYEIYEKK